MAKMDEANDERIVVVVKNEQMAIPRDEVESIDARPGKSRVTRETKTTTSDMPDLKPNPGPRGTPGPSTSSSSTISMGKADFEPVYRRPPQRPRPPADKQ